MENTQPASQNTHNQTTDRVVFDTSLELTLETIKNSNKFLKTDKKSPGYLS